MNNLWTLRWTTQRDVCQQLFDLLNTNDWPIDSLPNRRQLAAVLAVISDEPCAPRWKRILLDAREDPWIRLRARDALSELGDSLSEDENAALLTEWLAAFRQERAPFPLQAQDLVTQLAKLSDPSRYLASLRTLPTVHQGELLKLKLDDEQLPDELREPLQASWLAALQDDLSGLDVVWDMLDRDPVRRWALASAAPLSPIPVRRALERASLEQVEAFFEGFPHRLQEARDLFCLPLSAMAMAPERIVDAIHACFRENRAYRRVSPRSINGSAMVSQLGPDALREARSWDDIHPDLKKHWLPNGSRRRRNEAEDEMMRRASEADPTDRSFFRMKLTSAHAVDRYYALEGFAELDEVPDEAAALAERDPHPVVRIEAAGLLAMRDPGGLAYLRERARSGGHVCERAEALRWLEALDLEGSADIFIAALDDRESLDQYYYPALGQAIQAVQELPGDEAMTALLRVALRGPSFYTSDLIKGALRYRLGRAPALRWRFVWRRLALRRRTL